MITVRLLLKPLVLIKSLQNTFAPNSPPETRSDTLVVPLVKTGISLRCIQIMVSSSIKLTTFLTKRLMPVNNVLTEPNVSYIPLPALPTTRTVP